MYNTTEVVVIFITVKKDKYIQQKQKGKKEFVSDGALQPLSHHVPHHDVVLFTDDGCCVWQA